MRTSAIAPTFTFTASSNDIVDRAARPGSGNLATSKEVAEGQAVYTALTLAVYDLAVLGLSPKQEPDIEGSWTREF
jgi:hypothetical protein